MAFGVNMQKSYLYGIYKIQSKKKKEPMARGSHSYRTYIQSVEVKYAPLCSRAGLPDAHGRFFLFTNGTLAVSGGTGRAAKAKLGVWMPRPPTAFVWISLSRAVRSCDTPITSSSALCTGPQMDQFCLRVTMHSDAFVELCNVRGLEKTKLNCSKLFPSRFLFHRVNIFENYSVYAIM